MIGSYSQRDVFFRMVADGRRWTSSYTQASFKQAPKGGSPMPKLSWIITERYGYIGLP